ncbi:MAG: hypothetical protein EOO52_01900 [Gammaproteobacteria bacterium]|nr:MAG: hypothetical protein EOO52_01900 [Gammaproteobacteria bacterium]
MSEQHRFLISFITSNQPQSIEATAASETLSKEDAEVIIRSTIQQPSAPISDIQVVGLHKQKNPNIHPGHYQQPEG